MQSLLQKLLGQKTPQDEELDERKREFDENEKRYQDQLLLTKEKTDAEVAREKALTDEAEARTALFKRTDPNRPRGGSSVKDVTTNALRASVDTYLNRSKALPLSPEEQADFDAKNLELNRRLGVKPGTPKPATQPTDAGFNPVTNLLKFLTGSSTNAPAQAEQKPKWQQYD